MMKAVPVGSWWFVVVAVALAVAAGCSSDPADSGGGAGTKVAFLSHQSRGTPCDLAALGAQLAEDGFHVVAWTADPYADTVALEGLIASERKRGARQIVLVGASAGGSSSITAAAAARPQVDAVVALSPADFAKEPGDVEAAATDYSGPLFLAAGEQEPGFRETLNVVANAHDGPEQVDVVKGTGDHGKELVNTRDSATTTAIRTFLTSHLAGPTLRSSS